MNFRLTSLLFIVLFPALSVGLKCQYCIGTDIDKMSPCPEGQATDVRECIEDAGSGYIYKDHYHCRYRQSYDGIRTHLGCEFETIDGISSPQYEIDKDIHDTNINGHGLYCRRDLCNNLEVNKLKCLACNPERSYNCAEGEKAVEKTCLLDYNMCFNLQRNHSSGKLTAKIGCRHKFQLWDYPYGKYSKETEPFDFDEFGDQAYFCFTNGCNTHHSKADKKKAEENSKKGGAASSSSTISYIILSIAFNRFYL